MSTPLQTTPTGSKLDNASKEDLIKLLKRQQLLVKKSNTDNDAQKAALQATISSLRSELEAAQSSGVQLRQENDDIYSSNKKLTSDSEELRDEVKCHEQTIHHLESSVMQLSNEKEDHLSELDVLRDNKEQMKGLVQMLQQSEYQLKEQISDLKSQLEIEIRDRDSERNAWKENIRILGEQIEESNAKLAEAEKNASLQKELYQAKSDIASLKSEGDSLKSLIKEYNEQFAVETSTISQVLSALENSSNASSAQEDLIAEVKELRSYIEKLELKDTEDKAKIEQLLEQNEQLKEEQLKEDQLTEDQLTEEQLHTLKNVNEYHVSHSSESKDEDTKLKDRICQLEEELNSSTSEVSVLEEKMKKLEEEKRKIKLHLDEFISENANFKDQRDTEAELQAQYEAMKCTVEEQDLHIKDLNSEVFTLNSELAVAQQRLLELADNNEAMLENLNANQEALDISSREQEKVKEESETLLTEISEEVEELSSELEKVKEELGSLESERDSLSSQVFVFEEQISQLSSDLESERTRIETLEHSAKETAKVIASKENDILRLSKDLEDAIESNNRLREDTQGSHHLMDMELADYQRAAHTLQDKLTASKGEVAQLESELEKKEEAISRASNDIKELEKQRSSLDEMITKLKVLLMKAKKEAADSKKSEEDSKLECDESRQTLEQTVQNLEDAKLELSDAQGQLNSLKECSRKKSDDKSAMLKNMETRLTSMQEEVERERDMRVEIAGQFESYKVRVHSVLKQQKSNDTVIGISEHEAIVIQLSKEVEMLKCQVYELKMSRDGTTSQKEELEEELSAVLNNLEKIERESTEREKFYLERVSELEDAVRQKEQQIFNNLQGSASQRAALTESYTKTLEQTNATHTDASQILQNRITRLEAEISANTALQPSETPETSTPIRPPKVRLGAEGMESPAPSTTGLEDILNNTRLSRSSSRVSMSDGTVTKEDSKIAHLSTLLSESEHNAAALQEQCAVLKGEVRRLENMLGRDNTNIEYLKNVVMKYLCSEPASREQLVPVLSTVLKLTREEVSLLTSSAGLGKREQVPWTSTWFYSSS